MTTDWFSKSICRLIDVVVILGVLTEREFRISLLISQLLAKAIPVRGAKFRKARTRKLARAFCFLGIIESLADLDFIHNDVVLTVLKV